MPERDNGLPVLDYTVRIAQLADKTDKAADKAAADSDDGDGAPRRPDTDIKETKDSGASGTSGAAGARGAPAIRAPAPEEVRSGRDRFYLASGLPPRYAFIHPPPLGGAKEAG